MLPVPGASQRAILSPKETRAHLLLLYNLASAAGALPTDCAKRILGRSIDSILRRTLTPAQTPTDPSIASSVEWQRCKRVLCGSASSSWRASERSAITSNSYRGFRRTFATEATSAAAEPAESVEPAESLPLSLTLVPTPHFTSRWRHRLALSIHRKLKEARTHHEDMEETLLWLAKPQIFRMRLSEIDALPKFRDTVRRLVEMSSKILLAHRPPHLFRFCKVLSEHAVAISLMLRRRGGHRSQINGCVEAAGRNFLMLLPDDSDDPEIWALRGAALTFVDEQTEAREFLERLLGAKANDLQAALVRSQQITPQNRQIFLDIAQLFQAILEGEIAHAMGRKLYPRLHSQRMEMQNLRMALHSATSVDADLSADARRAQDSIRRFRFILDRANLAVPTANHLFPDTMLAFDDLVVLLGGQTLRKFCADVIRDYRSDREGCHRILIALSASLLRLDRLSDAVNLFLVAESAHVPLPGQISEALIRHGSRTVSDEIVDSVIAVLMKRPPSSLDLSTWVTVAGHTSRRGNLQLLTSIWKRILELFPSAAKTSVLKDHFLVVYASGRGTYPEFKRYLHENYNVPGSDPAHMNPKKRDFHRHTFQVAIRGHAKGGNMVAAEDLLTLMENSGYGPDLLAHHQLLAAYSRRSDIGGAMNIWRRIQERGLQPNAITYELMARLLANRGDLQSALAILGTLEDRKITLSAKMIGVLMAALTRSGEHDRALELFEKFASSDTVNTNVHAWNAVLRIQVSRMSPLSMVMQTLREMKAAGVIFNSRTYALAMQSACETGNLAAAEHLFAEADGGEATQSEHAEEDEEEKEEDDVIVVDGKLDEKYDTTKFVHPLQPENDFAAAITKPRADIYHFTILIHAHLRLGNISAAKEYFDEMQRRKLPVDGVNWSLLARAYMESDSEESQWLARDIIMRKMEDAERATVDEDDPDAELVPEEKRGTTAETLISPLLVRAAQLGDVQQVESIIGELEADGIELSASTMNVLLGAYRQALDVESMLKAWERIFARAKADTGYAAEMQYEDALHASGLESGRSRGFQRTGRSSGSSSRPLLVGSMKVAPVKRNALCISLSIVLDTLLQTNRHEAIAGIWSRAKAAGFAFDPSNWNDLTIALCRAGRIEDALRLLEDVLNEISLDSGRSVYDDPHLQRRRQEEWRRMRGAKARRKASSQPDQVPTPMSSNERRRRLESADLSADELSLGMDVDHGISDLAEAQPDDTAPGSNVGRTPIFQALARQGRFEETQAIWVASRATLHEIQDALDRRSRVGGSDGGDGDSNSISSSQKCPINYDMCSPPFAEGETETGGGTRVAPAASSSMKGVADLLSRYPRAAYILEVRRRRDRALQEREDRQAEQMIRQGRL